MLDVITVRLLAQMKSNLSADEPKPEFRQYVTDQAASVFFRQQSEPVLFSADDSLWASGCVVQMGTDEVPRASQKKTSRSRHERTRDSKYAKYRSDPAKTIHEHAWRTMDRGCLTKTNVSSEPGRSK